MGTISRRSALHLVFVLGAVAGLGLGGCDSTHHVPPPPVAIPQSLATLPDVAVDVRLSGTDPSAGLLTFAVASPPSHGTLTGTDRLYRYTPASRYVGPDSFTFTVANGAAISTPAPVSIEMLPTTGPPYASGWYAIR